MPGFDVEAARSAGYSDDEILSHLTQSRKFDVQGALNSGYSKQDIINHLSGTRAAEQTKTKTEDERTLSGFLGNVISSGGQMVSDIATAVSHPRDTAEGIFKLTSGAVGKLIPGEQMDEKNFDALVKMYAERYGSWDNFTKTLYEDPVGVLADLSTAAGGASGMLKLGKATKLAKVAGTISEATDPVALATKGITAGVGATRGAVSSGLTKSAEKNYMEVLLPSKKASVPTAEKTARQMAEKKIVAGSRERLQKQAEAGKQEWGPKAGEAFAHAQPIKLSDAADAIELIKDKKLYVPGTKTVPANHASLEKFFVGVEDDLKKLANPQGEIPAQIFDNYIDDINKGLVGTDQTYRTSVAPKTLKGMEQSTARAFRVLLDTPNPKASQINAIYSMYANVYQFAENTRRSKITSKSALATGSAKGFGALVERNVPKYFRNLPRAITGVFDSVPWNTVSGATKMAIADALANGHFAKAEFLMKKASKPATVSSRIGAYETALQGE